MKEGESSLMGRVILSVSQSRKAGGGGDSRKIIMRGVGEGRGGLLTPGCKAH